VKLRNDNPIPGPAMRRFLLVILLLSLLGTGAELLLIDHLEDPWQWAPVLLIAAAFPLLLWLAAAPGAVVARVWQGLMALFILSGFVGLWLHAQAKMEFKQETNPSLSGPALFWQAMKSISPPALAPGVMIQTGLLGLAYAYISPWRKPRTATPSSQTGETE
jgi:hypothetical protein